MKKSFYTFYTAVFFLGIIWGGILNISPAIAAQDTVKIGLSAPLTGDWAEYGNDFKRSVTMVIDRINRMGGIHGKKVILEIADSRGDPKESVLIAEKFVADPEIIAEIGRGEIFGEMSLLSGEPASSSVQSRTVVKFGTINGKDLKFILNRYPGLQIFFYRLLVNRAQMNMARAGKISSGMSGELIYINPVELFQLINSGGKSGKVDLIFHDGHATILFKEGEIIHASFGDLRGKEALFALLSKKKGSFNYNTELAKKYEELPVLGGFMGLLMEGLQRIDEISEEQG